MKKQFIDTITKELTEKESINITVSIECAEINLQNCHNLEVEGIEETENTIELATDILTFKIGKNYTKLSFDEYENEYTFEYVNGVVITVTII